MPGRTTARRAPCAGRSAVVETAGDVVDEERAAEPADLRRNLRATSRPKARSEAGGRPADPVDIRRPDPDLTSRVASWTQGDAHSAADTHRRR